MKRNGFAAALLAVGLLGLVNVSSVEAGLFGQHGCGAGGCCGPTTPCAASAIPCMEAVCCDDWAVINGIPAECAAADPWSCVDVPDLGNPNCCANDADCG